MAQQKSTAFRVMPLGVRGGLDESNLSAYMIAPFGSTQFICADAGTIFHGIETAITSKQFRENGSFILKNYIKGYLISHAHLDHVAGLIMNSPEDSVKNIYALPAVLDILKDKYFSWRSWANFGDQGEKPTLNKYHYAPLQEHIENPLANTGMSVTAFALSHSSPYQSTAFLLNNKGRYLLYLGDTGADSIENSRQLEMLWQTVAPLVSNGSLRAIFIEVSFPDEQPAKLLFGHLTPSLLMKEMNALNRFCLRQTLQKLSVVITHRKSPASSEVRIRQQLQRSNSPGLKLVFPEQGKGLYF